jgi:hypothetical protein
MFDVFGARQIESAPWFAVTKSFRIHIPLAALDPAPLRIQRRVFVLLLGSDTTVKADACEQMCLDDVRGLRQIVA